MLNYNLNINSPLQQEKKNEDVRPPIYWDFHSFASASDSTDLSERTFATMSINAFNTNCIQVSVDSGNSFTSDAQSPVTASVTGSNWPITGSTTMSLFTAGITYDPLAVDQYFSASVSASGTQIIANPSISGSIITNKFLTSEFYRWYVSGSVIHIKGNVFNPLVKVLATGSIPTPYAQNTGSLTTLNIVKNVNEPISMSIGNITGSQSSSFQYAYAFNVTASLTGSNTWPRSASFIYPTSSLIIPELGINRVSYVSSSILTASFAANTNTTYTITASINARYIPNFSASLIVVGGGGGGAAGGAGVGPGGGGGAGGYQYINVLIQPNVNYNVDIVGVSGSGGIANIGASSGSNGTLSKLTYWVGPDIANGTASLIASGGFGADSSGNGGASGNGFAGGSVGPPANLGLRAGGGGGGTSETGSVGGNNGIGANANAGGDGGNGLGGGGGANGTYSIQGGFGGDPVTLYLPFPNTALSFFISGSGGEGGKFDGANTINGAPGLPYGAGGGGSPSQNSTSRPGGDGSNGVVAIVYAGQPKLTIENGYTDYFNGLTYHYITGSNSNFSYIYEPVTNPPNLI